MTENVALTLSVLAGLAVACVTFLLTQDALNAIGYGSVSIAVGTAAVDIRKATLARRMQAVAR